MLQRVLVGQELSRLSGVLLTVLVAMMRHVTQTDAATVYFNSYGHCIREDFSLEDEVYNVKAVGATAIHESLICDMTFRAPPSTGVCLTFKSFHIMDCGVTLNIYQEQRASGSPWKRLSCEDNMPTQMCTPERYVTLKLVKKKLNNNRNYEFHILVEKSSNLTGEDVILASSIGLFVGIIAGIVALIAVLSVIIFCCCCRPCRSRNPPPRYEATGGGQPPAIHLHPPSSSSQGYPAQPSAPPATEVVDEYTPLQQGPLYPALPPQSYPVNHGMPVDPPPPPYAPPPYEQHAYPTKD